jgi:hypothetical protein
MIYLSFGGIDNQDYEPFKRRRFRAKTYDLRKPTEGASSSAPPHP